MQCCESLIQGVSASPLQNTDYLDVRWSNNGDGLALSAYDPEIGHGNIWIIPTANPANAEQVNYDTEAARGDVAWSPDDNQLIYLRQLRGMCGEGSGKRVKGSTLAVSNIDLTDDGKIDNPIDNDGLLCDEVAIVRGVNRPRHPDWWRGALCGNGVKAGIEQCDDGNNVDDNTCSAICMLP